MKFARHDFTVGDKQTRALFILLSHPIDHCDVSRRWFLVTPGGGVTFHLPEGVEILRKEFLGTVQLANVRDAFARASRHAEMAAAEVAEVIDVLNTIPEARREASETPADSPPPDAMEAAVNYPWGDPV